jgi:hypothetical protein
MATATRTLIGADMPRQVSGLCGANQDALSDTLNRISSINVALFGTGFRIGSLALSFWSSLDNRRATSTSSQQQQRAAAARPEPFFTDLCCRRNGSAGRISQL